MKIRNAIRARKCLGRFESLGCSFMLLVSDFSVGCDSLKVAKLAFLQRRTDSANRGRLVMADAGLHL